MTFSEMQLEAISITERVTSVFSLMGTGFIIVTFLMSDEFHKPINRLVFYAAFGNIITNVATIMSRSGIEAGPASALCQTQAFLIQMFMPADSLWTLAMACNVYLTFFKKYSAAQLKKMEWKYFVICYGLPFIPAMAYCFIDGGPKKGKIYGPATLWCWVTPQWDILRVATFYGPVWIVVLITICIYIRAGIEIYQKRRQLRFFSQPGQLEIPENPFVSTKTTKIEVTSEPVVSRNGSEEALKGRNDGMRAMPHNRNYMEYSITIESGSKAHSRVGGLDRARATMDANTAAWGYTRIAFLFFVALLITWVPSSVNRVYSIVHPKKPNYPLNFIASFVLPLQGFWNGLIYFTTSLPACRKLWLQLNGVTVPPTPGFKRDSTDLHSPRSPGIHLHSRGKDMESESQRSFAHD